jgi:exosortase/archaeosortase family protein
MRLAWFETHALLPLTQVQARLAEMVFGTPVLPIQVTLACSGADALSLCVGAILAYPTSWRLRFGGAAAGIALVLALNTMRIGTLGRAAGSPAFDGLHVYLWPGILTLAVAGYVFAWMHYADGPRGRGASAAATVPAIDPGPRTVHLTWRFVGVSAGFLAIFTAASQLYLGSDVILSAGAFVARAAAAMLGGVGVHAAASANVLSTERGAFLVTQACITTPLIPVYLAAVAVYLTTWSRRAVALAALVPLFLVLGIARLLVVALPPALVSSPAFLVHAFSQFLIGGLIVYVAARWRHGGGATARHRALAGAAIGSAVAYLLSAPYTQAIGAAFGTPLTDPQGAIQLLPAFQVGLYVALFVAAFVVLNWRLFLTGLAGLGFSQVVVFAAAELLARHAGLTPHARDVRGWAIAAPLLVVAALVTYERSRR